MGSTRPAPSVSAFAVPIAFLAGLAWFVLSMWNPVDDYRLMTGSTGASGEVMDAETDVQDCDDGADCTRSYIGYRFQSANGSWHGGRAKFSGGAPAELRKGSTVSVRYLPSNPDVNRLDDEGSQSMSEWLVKFVPLLFFVFAGWQVSAPLFKSALAGPSPEPGEDEDSA